MTVQQLIDKGQAAAGGGVGTAMPEDPDSGAY